MQNFKKRKYELGIKDIPPVPSALRQLLMEESSYYFHEIELMKENGTELPKDWLRAFEYVWPIIEKLIDQAEDLPIVPKINEGTKQDRINKVLESLQDGKLDVEKAKLLIELIQAGLHLQDEENGEEKDKALVINLQA